MQGKLKVITLALLLFAAMGALVGCGKKAAATHENTEVAAAKSVVQIHPSTADGTYFAKLEIDPEDPMHLSVQILHGKLAQLTVTNNAGDELSIDNEHFIIAPDPMDAVDAYMALAKDYPFAIIVEIKNPAAQDEGSATTYAVLVGENPVVRP